MDEPNYENWNLKGLIFECVFFPYPRFVCFISFYIFIYLLFIFFFCLMVCFSFYSHWTGRRWPKRRWRRRSSLALSMSSMSAISPKSLRVWPPLIRLLSFLQTSTKYSRYILQLCIHWFIIPSRVLYRLLSTTLRFGWTIIIVVSHYC